MRVSAFVSSERGTVLVEAALAIPVLLVIFMAMVDFSEAFAVKRKSASVATATADLVAQQASVTTQSLTDITSIASTLLSPYPATPFSLTITSVTLDANGNPSIAWTFPASTAAAQQPGAPFPLPSGLTPTISATQCIIVAQSTYSYQPLFAQFLTNGVAFTSSAYFMPRLVPCIPAPE